MSPRAILLAGVLGALGAFPDSPSPRSPTTLVFEGVDIVTMTDAGVASDRDVVVRDGRIAEIRPAGRVDPPPDAVRVDGRGRTLVPGLVDAHVHAAAWTLPLFVAHGVTSVRAMHGDSAVLSLRDEVRRGERMGPRMVVAGPLLAGGEVPWPHRLVTSPSEARVAIAEHVRAGYDFVKVYDHLSPDVYQAITDEAALRGLTTVGHVPVEVGVATVVAADQRSIEHVEQILYATFGRDSVMTMSLASLPAAVEPLVGRDVFVTPTLAGMERLMRRGTSWHEALFDRRPMEWVPASLKPWWTQARGEFPGYEALERRRRFFMLQQELAIALHRAGIPLLAGTDTPYPLLVPGLSLHDELAAMVEVGLTPREALATATVNPARLLSEEGERGVVAPGAIADLVLVEGDPLEDTARLRRPAGVVLGGRWLPRESLDRLLDPVGGRP